MLAVGGIAPPAYVGSGQARCEVRKDGQAKQGQSGPCTFSQRQGDIDRDLRNGETDSLSPGNTDAPILAEHTHSDITVLSAGALEGTGM